MTSLCGLAASGCLLSCSAAGLFSVTVKIENLAPVNSVSFAPLRVGFGTGSFDAFDQGETATMPIISVAEGGSGSDWFPAFSAAEPGSVLGSVGGALLPGSTASSSFIVDPSVNRFFTFASMVIPSNDLFIGNDDPLEYQILDASGNLLISSILQTGAEIWDANSEALDPANAAFIVGGINSQRTPENGLVAFDFTELDGFNGLTTAAGYTFGNSLTDATDIYRISFSVEAVPESSAAAVPSALALGFLAFRRYRQAQHTR